MAASGRARVGYILLDSSLHWWSWRRPWTCWLATSCGGRSAWSLGSSTFDSAWCGKSKAKVYVVYLPAASTTLSHQLSLFPRTSIEGEAEISSFDSSCAGPSLSHELALNSGIICHFRRYRNHISEPFVVRKVPLVVTLQPDLQCDASRADLRVANIRCGEIAWRDFPRARGRTRTRKSWRQVTVSSKGHQQCCPDP